MMRPEEKGLDPRRQGLTGLAFEKVLYYVHRRRSVQEAGHYKLNSPCGEFLWDISK
jgi:hypothetical protein